MPMILQATRSWRPMLTYTYDNTNRQEKVIDPEGVTVAFNSYDEILR